MMSLTSRCDVVPSVSPAQRVIARFEKAAVTLTPKWLKAKKDDLKARLKRPLKDSPDVWAWALDDAMHSFFTGFVNEFNDMVSDSQARQSIRDRFEAFKDYLKALVEKLNSLRALGREHVDFGDPAAYLRWTAVNACEKKLMESAKTIGDLYKYQWRIDETVIDQLVQKTLKKATPEQRESLKDSSEPSVWVSNDKSRTRYEFLASVKFEEQAVKAVKKTKLDHDPVKRLEFVVGVLESLFSEKAMERYDAYREFDFHGMKVVIDDSSVDNSMIPRYIKYIDQAYQMLRAKRLESAWYGVFFVKCTECGGSNHNTGGSVGGRYHIGPDTVTCYVRPDPFVVELLAHELGHRYWFKQMKSEQRARFTALVRTHTLPRPRDAVSVKLIRDSDASRVKREILEAQRKYEAVLKGLYGDGELPDQDRQRVSKQLRDLTDDMTPGIEVNEEANQDPEVLAARKDTRELQSRALDAVDDLFDPAVDKASRLRTTVEAFDGLAASSLISVDIAFQKHNAIAQEKLAKHPETKKWLDSYDENPAPIEPVSNYGKSNIDEAFAEVFMHYVMNRATLTRDQLESFKSVLSKGHAHSRLAEQVLARFVSVAAV